MARSGMDHQAGGLVHHDDVPIGVDHRELDGRVADRSVGTGLLGLVDPELLAQAEGRCSGSGR